jgi:hypothetical protein
MSAQGRRGVGTTMTMWLHFRETKTGVACRRSVREPGRWAGGLVGRWEEEDDATVPTIPTQVSMVG